MELRCLLWECLVHMECFECNFVLLVFDRWGRRCRLLMQQQLPDVEEYNKLLIQGIHGTRSLVHELNSAWV